MIRRLLICARVFNVPSAKRFQIASQQRSPASPSFIGSRRCLLPPGAWPPTAHIRAILTDLIDQRQGRLVIPPARHCTDNAAMIAWAALEREAAHATLRGDGTAPLAAGFQGRPEARSRARRAPAHDGRKGKSADQLHGRSALARGVRPWRSCWRALAMPLAWSPGRMKKLMLFNHLR
jgi:hypothetical protein